jgi:hypothetical protein
MNKIKNARFIRSVQTNGKTVAEVEFSMELSGGMRTLEGAVDSEKRYIAILENNEGQSYKLQQVYRNDADLALDWYDNPLHQAYVDVTNDMFGDSQMSMDRESFVLDILDCEGVKADMEYFRD